MDNNESFYIPRNLDAPPLFFIWEADTALLYLTIIILSLAMNMFVMGLLLAIVVGRGYSKLKEQEGNGLFIKMIYWFTPSKIISKNYLPSHIREYIGG
ncbi:MAG: type IV conjugative transfer system protein TraL [Halobacteriovoraceae bacterium]|nr:type IV conjugative transfer system protein TraL [Halobacteriovoraceae bacterium]